MLSRYAIFTSSAPLNLTSNLCDFLNSSNAPQLIAFLDLQAAKVDISVPANSCIREGRQQVPIYIILPSHT